MKTFSAALVSCLLALGASQAQALEPRAATVARGQAATEAAWAYLGSRPDLRALELELRAALALGETMVVRFEQRHRGLPVRGSAVVVRVGTDGQVQRVIEEARALSVSVAPTVSAAAARSFVAAAVGVAVDSLPEPQLAVVPDAGLAQGGRLVWEVAAPSVPGGEQVVVDAHAGSLVARRPLAHEALGRVYQASPVLTPAPLDLPLVDLAPASPARLTTQDGQIAVYEFLGGSLGGDLAVQQSVGPSTGANFLYDPPATAGDATDAFSSVSGYFHALRARSFFADALGVDMTGPGWALGVVVNALDQGKPLSNSYFSSSGVAGRPNVIMLGQGVVDFAYDQTLVAHEFTHYVGRNAIGYNLGQFASDNRGFLAHSAGVDEGVADYFACSLTGEPVFGTSLPAKWQRDLSHQGLRCPDDVSGEAHADGQIIGSAAWSLRQDLGPARADVIVWGAVAMMTATSSMQDFAAGALETAQGLADAGTLSGDELGQVQQTLAAHGLLDCGRELSLDAGPRSTRLMGLDLAARSFGATCEQMTSQLQLQSAFSFSYRPGAGTSRVRLHADLAPKDGGAVRWSLLVRRDSPVSFHPSAAGFPEPDAVDFKLEDQSALSGDLEIEVDPTATYHAVIVHSSCDETRLDLAAFDVNPGVVVTSEPDHGDLLPPSGLSPVSSATVPGCSTAAGPPAGAPWGLALLALGVSRRRRAR